MPLQPFLDLIEANRVDQVVSSYETFDDLLDYCRLSAAPIGRIVLHIAGAADTQNVTDSDAVCAALQVLEHCQDVGEDARMGRVYLPSSELDGADVHAATTSAALRSVVRAQVARLSGWSKIAVAGYLAGGFATADALRAGDFDVLARTLKPSKGRTAYHVARLLVRR